MGNKKHIDKFFQEQFRDFEVNPPEDIWGNIKNELERENDKQKRVVPLWIQFSGIAASLIFLITVGVLQFIPESNVNGQITTKSSQSESIFSISSVNDDVSAEQSIVNHKSDVTDSSKNNINNAYQEQEDYASTNSINGNDVINKVNSKKSINNLDAQYKVAERSVTVQKNKVHLNSIVTKSAMANKTNSVKNQYETNNEILVENKTLNKSSIDEELLKYQSNPNKNITDNNTLAGAKNEFNKGEVNVKNQSTFINNGYDIIDKSSLTTNLSKSIVVANKDNIKQSESLINENSDNTLFRRNSVNNEVSKENSSIVSNSENLHFSNTENAIDDELLVNKNLNGLENNLIASSLSQIEKNTDVVDKDNIEDESKNADEVCVEEDVIVEEIPIGKTIEDAIAEQEIKKENDEDKEVGAYKKWEITPNVAPVYYNSLTSGSPIDDDFSGNAKKGQFTTSYGIAVGYAFNNRLSIRTGLNKLEVGYDTQDVAIFSSPETSGGHNYKNINFSSEGAGMSIVGSGTYSATQIPSSFSSLFDSSLNQRFGYLEVPLELSYKISDRKLSVDVIAGISTFFLNKNEIYSENKVKTTYLGEANNLNDTSYSTNLGIGLEYKISKTLNFNFDPMFKYQLNAFSNDAGNFKPYILGVYSGLSYRF